MPPKPGLDADVALSGDLLSASLSDRRGEVASVAGAPISRGVPPVKAPISGGDIHYFSVNADHSSAPAGTNWNNDGATGVNAMALGVSADASGFAATALTGGIARGQSSFAVGGGIASGANSVALARQRRPTVSIPPPWGPIPKPAGIIPPPWGLLRRPEVCIPPPWAKALRRSLPTAWLWAANPWPTQPPVSSGMTPRAPIMPPIPAAPGNPPERHRRGRRRQ